MSQMQSTKNTYTKTSLLIDFATQALAIHYNYMHLLTYTHSELYRIDIGNKLGKTNSAPHPYVKILLSPKIRETRDQPGPASFLQRGA
jgi:hypothetical protein